MNKRILVVLWAVLLTWSSCDQHHPQIEKLCLKSSEYFLAQRLEKDVTLLKEYGFRYDPNSSRPEKDVFLSTQFIDDLELARYVGIRAVYLTYTDKKLSEINYSYLLDINDMKELLPKVLSIMDSKEKFECFDFLELLYASSVERRSSEHLIKIELSKSPTGSYLITYVLKIN